MTHRGGSRWMMIAATVAPIVFIGASGGDSTPDYELIHVKRQVVRELPEPEVHLELGSPIEAGDLLRTGSRSTAEILAPEAGVTFRLGPKTRVKLASDVPGVLLDIERGRVHALFDELTGAGERERLVTTPSAVLAVRGTDYGVDVDGKGRTTVTVFSGVVDVYDIDRRAEPVRLRAGEFTEVRRGRSPRAPEPHGIDPGQWERGIQPGGMGQSPMGGFAGSGDRDPTGMGAGSGGSGSGGSGSGGSGSGGSGSGGGGRGGGGRG